MRWHHRNPDNNIIPQKNKKKKTKVRKCEQAKIDEGKKIIRFRVGSLVFFFDCEIRCEKYRQSHEAKEAIIGQ